LKDFFAEAHNDYLDPDRHDVPAGSECPIRKHGDVIMDALRDYRRWFEEESDADETDIVERIDAAMRDFCIAETGGCHGELVRNITK
jgi:hypothetical protein